MINLMWQWVNNPIALVAGFLFQLSCCKKEGSWKRKFLPLLLYLLAAAGCLAEGVFLSGQQEGLEVALMLCIFIGIHALVAETAWMIHGIRLFIKKKKEAKYQQL